MIEPRHVTLIAWAALLTALLIAAAIASYLADKHNRRSNAKRKGRNVRHRR